MIDLRTLRQRLLAASAFPLGAALAACPAPQTRQLPPTPHKPNWVMRWCGDADDQAELGGTKNQGERCASYFDNARVAKKYPDQHFENINGMTMIHFELDATASQGDECCYDIYNDPPPPDFLGRPLMAGATPIVARAALGGAWTSTTDPAPARPIGGRGRSKLAAFLARAWTRDALAEHASIASFARTTLELLAVGAPPELVRGATQAAGDEVRHAELCFDLVSLYAFAPAAPGPLPVLAPRPRGLAHLARTTFLEGCVAETTGAVFAAQQLAVCRDPDVRAALAVIAPDEARHAELAWATLGWLVAQGGDIVRRAVVRTAAELPRWATRRASGAEPEREALHTSGRLGHAEHRALFATTIDELVVPLAANLGIALTPRA